MIGKTIWIALRRKFDTAREIAPQPEIFDNEKAKIGIISCGSIHPAIIEARDRLDAAGVETSYLRLRALPISQSVKDFINAYDVVYVVENNYDGQLRGILQQEMPERASNLIQMSKCDGMPVSARWITDAITGHAG